METSPINMTTVVRWLEGVIKRKAAIHVQTAISSLRINSKSALCRLRLPRPAVNIISILPRLKKWWTKSRSVTEVLFRCLSVLYNQLVWTNKVKCNLSTPVGWLSPVANFTRQRVCLSGQWSTSVCLTVNNQADDKAVGNIRRDISACGAKQSMARCQLVSCWQC